MRFNTKKLLLASAISLALTACGGSSSSNDNDNVLTVEQINSDRAAQLAEANLIAALGASEAGRELADFTGSDRSFRAELNVFIPSAIDVDEENLKDNTKANVTLPLYEGVGPDGSPTYFIITEASTIEAAEAFGAILSPKLRYGALPASAAAAQRVEVNEEGRIIFRGDVDFSPVRSITPSDDGTFPPAAMTPGSVGDAEYSSLVVLPSGLVINAQIVANSTGIHDRIIFEETTNEVDGVVTVTNSFTADLAARQATFELLDGWQGGDRYYYHLVTDASNPEPATIEQGTYAPRLANLPTFGDSSLDGESVLLGFSPNVNGLSATEFSVNGLNRQGLNSTILDQDVDPVNVFPFDPDNSTEADNNYSPFWDAHLNQWTQAAIDNGQRRAITGFDDLAELISEGLVESFSGSPENAVENDFVFGLRASGAVINCPVIMQPFEGSNEVPTTGVEEITALATAAATEAGKTLEEFTGANREFSSDLNVFLRSTIAIDMENLRDNEAANATLPLYRGIGPEGEDVYYILTETSTAETSEIAGTILAPKLRFGSLPAAAAAAQKVTINDDGIMVFRGTVDFSADRALEGTGFPPTLATPGSTGDEEYSSLVVLPSGVVVNAQIVANSTGSHDRILDFDGDARWAVFQLLDGWEGGDPFYYHLVTDASDPGPATIELGTYAPRMANLPTFGVTDIEDRESVLLGFSPNTNGLTITNDGLDVTDINRQGLGSTIIDDDRDPVNIFPFDPDNSVTSLAAGNNYSPMWDAHLNQWSQAAIDGGLRRAIRGFNDLEALINAGSVESFSGSLPDTENDFLFGLRATGAVINCPVILHPFQGELAAGEVPSSAPFAPLEEATLIATLGATEAGKSLATWNGTNRSFADELNVFLPSAIDVDEPNLRDSNLANVTLPLYEGIDSEGKPTYFIITESSTQETAEMLGAILSPNLSFGASDTAAAAAQRVQVMPNGRIAFKGDVDFSPERILIAGNGASAFPPFRAQPGSVGDAEYSSMVVLPSNTVINAQIVANATGIHDRILSIDTEARTVTMQLLDGWQGGDRYYYHLVTDASDPVPATIELGTYAPRMAALSDLTGDDANVLLGFSPNTNGLTESENGASELDRQGLASTILDNDQDPVNIFPFDPDNSTVENNDYSPMWNAHLNSWTDTAIANGERRAITSFEDLESLILSGSITSFAPGVPSDELFGLNASRAIINCPVILQPFEDEDNQNDRVFTPVQ